jgi:hypothetical protein
MTVARVRGWLLSADVTFPLSAKQRRWPKARQALREAPRKRIYSREKFPPPLSDRMNRLLIAQRVRQIAGVPEFTLEVKSLFTF